MTVLPTLAAEAQARILAATRADLTYAEIAKKAGSSATVISVLFNWGADFPLYGHPTRISASRLQQIIDNLSEFAS